MSDSEKDKLLQPIEAARTVTSKGIPEEDTSEWEKTEFRNALEISAYLESNGWKVSKSTLYKHIKEAKLRPDINKKHYSLKAILRYARSFLVTRETKQKLDDEEIARKKAKKELEKLEEEIKHRRIKRLAEEGRLIPREDFELELAARAAVLEAGITHMIQTEAGRLINLVGGESEKMGHFIREIKEAFNGLLNEFAAVKVFHVLIEMEPAAKDKEESDNIIGR